MLVLMRDLLLLHSEFVLEQLEEGAGLLVVREIVDRPHHRASVCWTWHVAWNFVLMIWEFLDMFT